MKQFILVASFLSISTVALCETPAANSQQSKMKSCNAEAADKKGDERKTFMKTCLSASSAAAAPSTPQERMKSCNATAKEKALKGDERKKFMSDCLKAPK